MTQSIKAIIQSLLGLLSIIAAGIFVMQHSGLNVHSGEIFIYMFLLLTGFLVVPSFFFIKAVSISKNVEKFEGQTLTQKLSILMTVILGLALGCVILGTIWIMAFSK